MACEKESRALWAYVNKTDILVFVPIVHLMLEPDSHLELFGGNGFHVRYTRFNSWQGPRGGLLVISKLFCSDGLVRFIAMGLIGLVGSWAKGRGLHNAMPSSLRLAFAMVAPSQTSPYPLCFRRSEIQTTSRLIIVWPLC